MSTGTDLPETPEMAREWDRRASAYRRAGLCDPCASSASWGHALGWLRVPHPPCASCALIVATFPVATVHSAWRKWPKGRLRASSTRSSALLGVVSCPGSPDVVSRVGSGAE